MRSYSNTRCLSCGHEEVRYANVKKCRACRGPLMRPEPVDERDAELAALRASEAQAWEQAGSDRAELNIIGLELDALRTRLAIAERMARYLGWAFEQKLLRPNETTELLDQVLREWRKASEA